MIRDDLLTGPPGETAGAALARLNEFNNALHGSDWIYQVEYRPVGAHALVEAEHYLKTTLPPSYVRLLSAYGLPLLRYGKDGRPGPLLLEPGELRRGDFYLWEEDYLDHVPVEERDAVMDRLRNSVSFRRPDEGADNYDMFRTDMVNADGEMPVTSYQHDMVYVDPERFATFDRYIAALVDKYNRKQAAAGPDYFQ
ncbi:hypothetical protein [Planomonospora parontospora]|uniref:hypothetical protein n=1 Tax=Planomonospora parontospora TaxID=58119 RepID=UPI00177D496E|nr:hypothetical protein [Planomonospora parontospora]